MNIPANLQTGLTVKQAAKLMNVSERSVYMAARVQRDRPDLAAQCEAGTLSINAAYLQCPGIKKPTPKHAKTIARLNELARQVDRLSQHVSAEEFNSLKSTIGSQLFALGRTLEPKPHNMEGSSK